MAITSSLVSIIIKQAVPPIIELLKNKISPDELQRAIKAGIEAAEAEDKKLPLEQHLFLNSKPDSINGVPAFLEKFFQHLGVQTELAKPFNNGGMLDVDYLTEEFKKTADSFKEVNPVADRIKPWLTTFTQIYFKETTSYLRFKVAKENYFKQLDRRYDNMKFAGIAVSGEEERKALKQIFVMPDVVERAENKQPLPDEFIDPQLKPQQRLILEQKQLARLSTTSNNPLLANKLLTETRAKKAVILGAPGSGKSTLVSYFAVMVAQGNTDDLGLDSNIDWLPIVIEIRYFEENLHLNFLEYLHQFAESNLTTNKLPEDFFKHWLKPGNALILLDGIDEVAETSKRYQVVERIESFLNQYNGNIAIITSRPSGYKRDFFSTTEFPHYQLQPFDDEKIEQFINHWYDSRIIDPQEAERCKNTLRKALADNNRIKLLAKNPLLITIIALIHRYQAYLPKERHKLYDKAVETLLTSWDANKAISGHQVLKYLDLDDLRRLLESLARWIHSQGSTGDKEGGTQIDKDELLKWLAKYIKTNKQKKLHEAREEAKRFLSFIRERTGLLNEQGTNRYAFVHQTFQEYLCAQDINYEADDEDNFEIVLDCIKEHLHDAHWREVLLLLVAQQKPQKALKAIKAIYENNSQYEQWLHRDLLFAGSCLADSSKGIAVKDKEDLAAKILSALVEIEIEDENKIVRELHRQVFDVLTSFRETDWEEKTLELIKEHQNNIDRFRFTKFQVALGETEQAIDNLLALLQDDDCRMRYDAVKALENIGKSEPQVIEALLALLQDDDSDVRYHGVEALRKIGSSEPQLIEALLALLPDDDIEALLALLQDDDSDVRSAAAGVLVKIGSSEPQLIEALLPLLQDDDSDVRYDAAEALGNIGSRKPEVIEALLALLQDDDCWLRYHGVEALRKIGSNQPQVIEALLPLLQDDDDCGVRYHAVEALGNIGSRKPEVIKALLALLQDDDDCWLRYSAAEALGDIGLNQPQVIEALLPLLQYDDDSNIRCVVAEALRKIGSNQPQVIEALLPLLQDDDSDVRYDAVGVLVKIGKSEPQVITLITEWIEQHQNEEYVGNGIDVLWNLVADAD